MPKLSEIDMEELRLVYKEYEDWRDIASFQTPDSVDNYIDILEEKLYKLTQDAWGQ